VRAVDLFPLATLVVGAAIGLISSLFLEKCRRMGDVSARLLDSYLELRKELCSELSDLANLRIGEPLAPEGLIDSRDRISRLYFQYYDFLPSRVLGELNCLYMCLTDRENRIFVARGDKLAPASDDEIRSLILEISPLVNFRRIAMYPLKSADLDIRRAASVNYHARYVLRILNEDMEVRSLLRWSRSLRKPVRCQGEERFR
jgi:hypothetical protein